MSFSCGLAKQLSLSSTTALMSGSTPRFASAKTFATGMGTWSKVDTVACGRHREGLDRSLKAFNVAETFIRSRISKFQKGALLSKSKEQR